MKNKKGFAKKAVIIFGYPGAGKSTQAILVSEKLGYYHFNTGKVIEATVHDPKLQKDPLIRKTRKMFDEGLLMPPDFTLKLVTKEIHKLAEHNESIIFSASPRTMGEAYGIGKMPGIVTILEKEYGKKNVLPILLKVSEEESKQRNTKRLMCSVCGTPLLGAALSLTMEHCPFCGGHIYKRTLDDPNSIHVRFQEFYDKTEPVIKEMKKRGYTIRRVDGTKMPYRVFASILKIIHDTFKD